MLEIIDDINNSNLSSSAILVSFDVVDTFYSIDNDMVLHLLENICEKIV